MKKKSLYLIISICTSILLGIIYTYLFNVMFDNADKLYSMFYGVSWMVNLILQGILVICGKILGLISFKSFKEITFCLVVLIISLLMFLLICDSFRLLFYAMFIKHFN